jgi:hypothetical protein
MKKSGPIVRYTLDEIRDRIAKGEDKSDWGVVDRKTKSELEADIRSDPDADVGDPTGTWVRVPPGFEVRLVKKSA